MAATAAIRIQSTVTGLPEGGTDGISLSITNTSAVGSIALVAVTTVLASAASVSVPSSAEFGIIVPPATNTFPLRVTQTTAEVGLLVSSQVPFTLSFGTAASTFYLYTTGLTTFTARVILY